MTVSQATPAGRLYHLLASMRAKPKSQNIAQAWGEVLGIPVNRRAELLRMYSLVLGLPDEIAAEVSRVDPQKFNIS